jgi:hypothetical protein
MILGEMMNLPLVIAMVGIAQFSEEVDSCGCADDRFSSAMGRSVFGD